MSGVEETLRIRAAYNFYEKKRGGGVVCVLHWDITFRFYIALNKEKSVRGNYKYTKSSII